MFSKCGHLISYTVSLCSANFIQDSDNLTYLKAFTAGNSLSSPGSFFSLSVFIPPNAYMLVKALRRTM